MTLKARVGLSAARRWRAAAVATGAASCAACPQRSAVWVADGSRADRLVLQMADQRGGTRPVEVGVVRVERCPGGPRGGEVMWVVGPRDGSAPMRELVYGVTPAGAVSDEGPRPLTAGCYRVAVSGNGRTVFDVGPDGAVVERAQR